MTKERLSRAIWLKAGLAALCADGPNALRAEPLARAMGTTKGSFYWHFKDVPTYHVVLIDAWRSRALSALSDAVGTDATSDHRLRQFGRDILSDPTEPALRVWAQTHAPLAQALREVDDARLTYIVLLLRELGLANGDFARALQACLIGLPHLSDDANVRTATFDTLVDTVLAL